MHSNEYAFVGRRTAIAAFFLVVSVVAGSVFAPTPVHANPKYASMVVDHYTGRILHSRHADATRFPASLTKVMTLYILFDEMKAGRIDTSDRMKVSARAAAMPPSKIGLKVGGTIRVDHAIKALVTKSANDVAAVVAEHISGSEAAFAKRMTRKARQIGMRKTTFKNASGLPNSQQVTTARDMVTMARSIMVNHPTYYNYFKTRSFSYAGRSYRNHNRLLGRVSGVDGIKTGYTRASGFNLVSSRKLNDRHIVAVVMGGRSGKSRNAHMTNLLQKHLRTATAQRAAPRVPPGVQVAAIRVPLPPLRPGARPVATPQAPVSVASLQSAAPAETTAQTPPQSVESPAETPRLAIAGATPTTPVPQVAVPDGTIAMSASDVPPAPNDAQTDAQPTETAVAAVEDTGPQPVDPAAEIPTSGWAIQIGAVGSDDEARKLIEMAKSKSVPAIEDRLPFTEPTVKNGETFVRARFAGFNSARQAQNACRQMKKKGFGCFAISL